MGKYSGKVAVITGSSRGIGKAIAHELAKQGAYIVLNGRNQDRLKEAEELIKTVHTNVLAICSDVSTPEGCDRLISEAKNTFGRIDILVNNVGISMRGNVADLNPEVFKTVFESNVLGTVYPTIPAIPHIRETKGSIVFISSLAGIRGLPGLSAYSSSKMALRAIAESIRIEEAKNNVHVGIVFVGITDIEHNKETVGPDGKMRVLESRKGKKVQSTEEVAKAVVRNISGRRFSSVLTPLGKLNAFLQSRFPLLVEKIILANIKKFEEGSK
jgi:NAD(P)-dependent dehydrogenase (short-subunit alcohol dehydrogenase family)